MNKERKTRRKQAIDFSVNLCGKHVFGAYFNMAVSNFDKTLEYVFEKMSFIKGKKVLKGEDREHSFYDSYLKILYSVESGNNERLSENEKKSAKKIRIPAEKGMQLQKLLYKHFPVLRPMLADKLAYEAGVREKTKKSGVITNEDVNFARGTTLTDSLELLCLFSNVLENCRNFYTHKNPYNSPKSLEWQYLCQRKIAKKLEAVEVASRRLLKNREGLTTTELEFLTGIDHYQPVVQKDERGRTQKKYEEYDDFYFNIRGFRSTVDQEVTSNRQNHEDSNFSALSDFGVLYFCVLFLSKTYAKLFMEEARLFENSPFTPVENSIFAEILSVYRMRIPQRGKVNTDNNKDALALDIFGELNRCPIELYDTLHNENGKAFFHDKIEERAESTEEVFKRIRFNDRFPYLALRYIDEQVLFRRIRFQLRLGSFRYKFYEKKCVDGQMRLRRIQKEINGYGRLQEAETERIKKWEDLLQKREEVDVPLENDETTVTLDQFVEDSVSSTPYVTDRKATYNIHNNRIGLYWEESRRADEYKFFKRDPETGNEFYIPELHVNEDGKAPIPMPAPRCVLSTRDLPALLFYEHLLNSLKKNADKDMQQEIKQIPNAENVIIQCENQYRQFFKAIEEGKLKPFNSEDDLDAYLGQTYPDLLVSDLPKKIKAYLSGEKNDTEERQLIENAIRAAEEREHIVSRRLEKYNEDVKKIGSKNNKLGKSGFAEIQYGKIARLLVESMVEWQPTNNGGKDKLTSLNYEVLIGYLANYGLSSNNATIGDLTLEQVLKNSGLLNGANPHPFLSNVLNRGNRTIEKLYTNYLEEETHYLRSCINNIKSNPSVEALSILPFVRCKKNLCNNEEEVRKLAERYTTIQLPDGLFTQRILDLLTDYFCKDNKELYDGLQCNSSKDDPTLNAAYLITLYYKTVLKDEAQPFYNTEKKVTKILNDGTSHTFSFERTYHLFSVLRNLKEDNMIVPLYCTCEEIQRRLNAKVIDNNGKPVPLKEDNGAVCKDEQGNVVWKRKIKEEIEKYVLKLSDKDLKIQTNLYGYKLDQERRTKRLVAKERLVKEISEIKKNEKTIRRYKVQDMILFLIAKEMFVEILDEQDRKPNMQYLHLSRVTDDGFLKHTLKFYFPVYVGDETIYVEQENMSIKNYGEFYRFLYDERIESLLKGVLPKLTAREDGKKVIRYSDLMAELATYDRERSTVFKLIQKIEQVAYDNFEDLRNPSSDNFWYISTKNNSEPKPQPKRNNFRSLIYMLHQISDVELVDKQREIIIAIRNAFGHNTYSSIENISSVKNIPEVAKSILEYLDKCVFYEEK